MNIDELFAIFSQTVGAPRGALGVLAALWIYTGSLRPKLEVMVAFAWTLVVCIVTLIVWANQRLVSGPHPHQSPQDSPVVVVGGSNGLGLLVAAMFSTNGYPLAVMDREPMPISLAHCSYYQCDISDRMQTEKVAARIQADFGSAPSALVNCAGIARGGVGIINQSPEDIASVMDTNLMGGIWVLQSFLPAMIAERGDSGGQVVGISSATALAGPAGAAAYAASKAAVRTLYESLRHELASTGIRVLCFTPGQLDTRMFSSVQTPAPFLAPVLPGHELASQIFNAVVEGKQGEVFSPLYARLLPIVQALLPQVLVDLIRYWIGVDVAMATFQPLKATGN